MNNAYISKKGSRNEGPFWLQELWVWYAHFSLFLIYSF